MDLNGPCPFIDGEKTPDHGKTYIANCKIIKADCCIDKPELEHCTYINIKELGAAEFYIDHMKNGIIANYKKKRDEARMKCRFCERVYAECPKGTIHSDKGCTNEKA